MSSLKKTVVIFFLVAGSVTAPFITGAQEILNRLVIDDNLRITALVLGGQTISLAKPVALVSYEINNRPYSSDQPSPLVKTGVHIADTLASFIKLLITFTNSSKDTLALKNVLPMTKEGSEAYITGLGAHSLSRTHLFLPGKTPVNVVVPDNAWELGYNAIRLNNIKRLMVLGRRDKTTIRQGTGKRFETILAPGGSVQYALYAELYEGPWQQGLTRAFQQRWLYDLDTFNDALFQRRDLQWIRHTYVLHLMDAWDKFYYDATDGKYHLEEFLKKGKKLYGGDDVVSIWPTWPSLGIDQRNQFDLFADLPGGTAAMHKQADRSRKLGTKFFICYNPWDESTRSENHFEGISKLVAATTADGIVLDTKGESSRELQDAADKVRPGVVMYSEGMAVPKDMPGIVSGRVHNALYYVPMLNLNKFIKPEFAIYRVAELYKEKIRREFATSFFNGYGTEINIMAPGQPDWADEQYKYLGRTSMILRENTFNFTARGYTPLISTTADSIWVNQWIKDNKTIFTIYSTIPAGYKGKLFEVEVVNEYHFVDLWHHRLLTPVQVGGKWMIEAQTNAFDAADLGTNNEGEVDCIARLPELIDAKRYGDELIIHTNGVGNELRVWAGAPSYAKEPVKLQPGKHRIRISDYFGRFEGDIVVQLMKDGILMDETIVSLPAGTPRRVSAVTPTVAVAAAPAGMVTIPAGSFPFKTTNGDEFIGYPKQDQDSVFNMNSFYMDAYPVTNAAFKKFMDAASYKPSDRANFLKHWINGKIPAGQENYPVVYISYEDAKAYAVWAGKRLPTEVEWQYAAQTTDLREWPWTQDKPVVRKEEYVTNTLTVTQLEGIDSAMCNLGTGSPYATGAYRKGINPNGLYDLVGCVWQLTNDLYMTGSHRYIIMKGGSYFKPSSSWWYVQGGPRELHYRQFLLRVSQGFERNATVGFRCVKDRK